MSTRRQFLAVTSAACAAAALPKALLAQRRGGPVFSNASMGAYTQGLLTMANFTAVIGTTFTVFLQNGDVAYLQLQQVTPVEIKSAPVYPGSAQPSDGPKSTLRIAPVTQSPGDSFMLSFSAGGKTLGQDTYLVDHGTLGGFAVFLVPGTDAGGSATCCATFNYVNTTHFAQISPTSAAQPVVGGTQVFAPRTRLSSDGAPDENGVAPSRPLRPMSGLGRGVQNAGQISVTELN